ncbi:aminodeoxychorismate lyase [Oceanobacter mangrovi]|uniref:aminodeoxychorismate lyase n=1 Tax=Oceanobacter mangrovi TaxID=2862510 RepID=UPI0031BA9FA6
MLCRVAGQWQDHWPATDRGLQYGDGLFETMRLSAADVPLWRFHAARLQQGLEALCFPSDSFYLISEAMAELADQIDLGGYSAAKLLVSRGCGPRGYGLPALTDINIQLQLMDAADWKWRSLGANAGLVTGVSSVRLGQQPRLAGIKHLNRLEQVLARAEFAPQWHEAIMLDSQGQLVEGCFSNLYFSHHGQWLTPSLQHCGVNGVIRRWLLEQQAIEIVECRLDDLLQADAVVMSNSLTGIVPVQSIDSLTLSLTHPSLDVMKQLQQRLESLF